ncbi:hypothetical protein [uncultured Legionella sp.]|uniref:hypothetical protein n=1 Tax=uncultured Legionella sp. TaxID=210934 RepID=UPI002621408D|nr:hypothetical protein [uncultured Legionella sp.]
MKKLFAKFRLLNQQLPEQYQYIRYKFDFLHSVYLFICFISFIMGLIRWYESPLLALITLGYSLSGLCLLYFLNTHKEKIEFVCSLVLIQSYILAVCLYLLNFPHTLRLSFFFLLLSTALFLKGRKEGFRWMIAILVAICTGDVFFSDSIGYSHFDILVSSFAIICLFYILTLRTAPCLLTKTH